jgi:hypothetical protein
MVFEDVFAFSLKLLQFNVSIKVLVCCEVQIISVSFIEAGADSNKGVQIV